MTLNITHISPSSPSGKASSSSSSTSRAKGNGTAWGVVIYHSHKTLTIVIWSCWCRNPSLQHESVASIGPVFTFASVNKCILCMDVFVTHNFPFRPLLKGGKRCVGVCVWGGGGEGGRRVVNSIIMWNRQSPHSQRHSSDASLYLSPESSTIASISCFQRPSLLEYPQVSLQFGYLLLVLVCFASSVQL